jgi:tetratricopeptide (TPR) repeat protein
VPRHPAADAVTRTCCNTEMKRTRSWLPEGPRPRPFLRPQSPFALLEGNHTGTGSHKQPNALNTVGWYTARIGDYDTAREHCQAALTLRRRHHDPSGEASTLDSLGYIDHRSGHHTQAIDHYHHALTLFRDLGNIYQVATTLDQLGHPHAALDQTEQARAVWQEALQLYQEQGRHDDATRVQHQLDNLDDSRRGAGGR